MAALNQAPWFNENEIAPTDDQQVAIANMQSALFGAVRPEWVAYLANKPTIQAHDILSVSADSSGYSVAVPLPFPIKLIGADLGCIAAAGATGTMDVEYSDDDGSTWASVFAAAKNVKAAAGTAANYAPETTAVDLDKGWLVRAKATSGSGGALTGAHANLWYVRR